MVAYKIFSFLAIAVAAVVAAPPSGGPDSTTAVQQCGTGQVVSCCNSPSSGDKNVLPLGLDCLQVPIALLNLAGDHCQGNTASCCQGDQDGLINLNLACTPIQNLI